MVSISVLLTFSIEVISYVIFNLGFTMSSPMSLPLISYGGSATIINMALIGIMLSAIKSDKLIRDTAGATVHKKGRLIEIDDGKITIYYK